MDPLAHGLAGALMARTHPSKERGLLLACVAGALIPDIDILLSFFDRHTYILEHRGFTHSFLGLIPMTMLAAWLTQVLVRRSGPSAPFRSLALMAFLGVASHLYLDLCTSWGIMLLWPDRTRFAWDSLFIVDPWYWLLFSLPLAASFFWSHRGRSIAGAGLLLIALYHALTAFDHRQALAVAAQDRPQAWKVAFPQPFSPFRWSVFDRADGTLRNAHVDLLGRTPVSWEEWKEPPSSAAIQAAMGSPMGRQYLWFARVPMWEEMGLPDGSVEVHFWDARFNNYMMKDRISRRFGAVFKVKDGKVVESDF